MDMPLRSHGLTQSHNNQRRNEILAMIHEVICKLGPHEYTPLYEEIMRETLTRGELFSLRQPSVDLSPE